MVACGREWFDTNLTSSFFSILVKQLKKVVVFIWFYNLLPATSFFLRTVRHFFEREESEKGGWV